MDEDRISFDLGIINVQPAELAKFTTLLMLAAFLAEERSDEVSYARFLGGLIIVGIPAVLVIVQPDLGSASVIVSIAMGVLLVAGAKIRYIFLISFLSIATVAAAFVGNLVNSYQVARIHRAAQSRRPPESDDTYQADNAMRALGHRRSVGEGLAEGSAHQRRRHPRDVGRLPVRCDR